MAGKDIAAVGKAFTADGGADGYAAISSTTGFFVGAKCNVSSDSLQSTGIVTEIKSATSLGIRLTPALGSGLKPATYGRSDLSAYTLAEHARVDQPEQFQYNAP